MSGTKEGGLKAAARNLAADPNFYRKIGRLGGKASHGGGFASLSIGRDGKTGPQRAKLAGQKGGRAKRKTERKGEK